MRDTLTPKHVPPVGAACASCGYLNQCLARQSTDLPARSSVVLSPRAGLRSDRYLRSVMRTPRGTLFEPDSFHIPTELRRKILVERTIQATRSALENWPPAITCRFLRRSCRRSVVPSESSRHLVSNSDPGFRRPWLRQRLRCIRRCPGSQGHIEAAHETDCLKLSVTVIDPPAGITGLP